ncbi:hypothetical protein [Sphingomonas psychrotolerans]|uniref:Uncharacterized protein n=1 Tax=Sphingomonas psychrotolerans TaxID=1327635 RepID=A0A2K8MCH9_9SPHN|nr:hypothetical protein [Sphingomonas psychrotolerans]ATY31563.1 hypothetical protein CVN68_05885 [Sphingomonas psychrotolerans]
MRNTLIAAALICCASAPALAQQAATTTAKPQSAAERIAELEGQLIRQERIADNARQSMEAMRAEMKLRDELLVLGRERNAELYAVAMEIAEKHVRRKDWEPFTQHSRVRMENLKQSYEDRLRAARITAETLPPSVQQRMDAELGTGAAAKPAPQPN